MPPPVQELRPLARGGRDRPLRGALKSFALDENRRTFVRAVSHELRTPLNSVIGFSEIISRQLYGPISDPRYVEHARSVHESGLRLMKLVNDVLDIARLEAGAMDLNIRAETAAFAVGEAIRVARKDAERRDVTISFNPPADLPLVRADLGALERILGNLLHNAVAYSPPHSVVDVQVFERGGDIVFEISDQGEGVAEEDLERMMKPFEQAETALVRRLDGAGLDIAIVGLLARTMGGEFSVSSGPGQGLTTIVELPAAAQRERASA